MCPIGVDEKNAEFKGIIDFLRGHEKNYIFGAGSFGTALCELLQENGKDIDGFIVTDKKDQIIPDECLAVKVFQSDEIKDDKTKCGVLFGVNSKLHAQIREGLIRLGYRNFYIVADSFLREVMRLRSIVDSDIFRDQPILRIKREREKGRILLIRLDGIGDVVLTTPLIRELHKNYPNKAIDVIVAPYAVEVFSSCPYVDRVISFDWKKLCNATIRGKMRYVYMFISREMPGIEYDVAIVPRWDIDDYCASILCYLSGATDRIGYSENVNQQKSQYNKGYDGFFTKTVFMQATCHEVEKNLKILESMGGSINNDLLEIWHEKEADEYARNVLGYNSSDDLIYIGVGFFAGAKKRIWDYRNYIRLFHMLFEKNNKYRFVLLGGKDSVDLAKLIANECSDIVINLAGRLSLKQSMAVFRYTKAYIGSDTGLMHIAAACRNTVFEISCFPRDGDNKSSNSIARFGPWKTDYVVFQPETGAEGCVGECNKDYAHCINKVLAEDIAEAVSRSLG